MEDNIITVSIKLKAQGINAINNYVVYGYPSPFTFWGFAHSLALKCDMKLDKETILPIVHYYRNRTQGYSNTFTQNRSSQRLKNGKISTITDLPKGDIECTILMKFASSEDFLTEDILRKQLIGMRFGGGTILEKSIKIELNKNESEVIKKISNGFIYTKENIQLSKDKPFYDFSNELLNYKDSGKGWRIPTLLGYALIEKPQQRKGVRFDYKHSFAEPLIGIAKFTKFIKYGDNKMSIENNGWKLEVSENNIEIINGDK